MNPQTPPPFPVASATEPGTPPGQLPAPTIPAATPLSAAPSPVPTTAALPPAAEDNDQIEPEWIHKAEQIVSQTQNDPYAQAQALNALKADYMQKRYAKTVKVAEG